MKNKEKFTSELFKLSNQVRYVAVYDEDGLYIQQRNEISNASAGESDKYEELLVNPTLIKLASQRGNIDCGGLEYFIIRYGNFFVLLVPLGEGHVNLGIEPGENPITFIEPLRSLIEHHTLAS
jgi:hypothetical protein